MSGIERFSRWVYKTIYRNTHSKQYQHNKNLWPYFKVIRSGSGELSDVFFKGNRISSIDLNFSIKNKPLVIMATGPSVGDINSDFFDESFDYLGVNGAFSMRTVMFDWYVILDRDFVKKRLALVKEIVARKDLVLFCGYASLEVICSSIPFAEIRCQMKIIEIASARKIERFLMPSGQVNPDDTNYHWHNDMGFSDKIERFLFDYGTVTYPALQIACLLGYKKIYIAGLDMNNFNLPRFYETSEDKLPTRLAKDFENISRSFHSAQAYCSSHNIQVINLSPNSAIDAFPKIRWDKVIKEA